MVCILHHGLQETLLAIAAGVTEKDFEQMQKTEARVIETARKRAIEKPPIEDIMELYTGVEYSTQDGNKYSNIFGWQNISHGCNYR